MSFTSARRKENVQDDLDGSSTELVEPCLAVVFRNPPIGGIIGLYEQNCQQCAKSKTQEEWLRTPSSSDRRKKNQVV